MDIGALKKVIGEFVDEVLPDQPPSLCARCGALRDCRDVLHNGTMLCLDCSTPRERDAFFRRLAGVDPVS